MNDYLKGFNDGYKKALDNRNNFRIGSNDGDIRLLYTDNGGDKKVVNQGVGEGHYKPIRGREFRNAE